jgi:hypothetical protein
VGSIWKENQKRTSRKSSVPAFDNHDIVRVEDLDGLPSLTPASGALIIGSGTLWTVLSLGPNGTVPKSVNGTIEWLPDVSGILSVDLSASGFVVGPAAATNGSIAIYDGTTGKLITDTLATIDASGNTSIGGDLVVSGDFSVLGNNTVQNLTVNNNLTVIGNVINSGLIINTVSSGTAPTFTITNTFFNAITSTTTGVFLPATPTIGQQHVIKDINGTAAATPITVDGNGNTIDGSSSIDLVNNYESTTLIFGPTEWNII